MSWAVFSGVGCLRTRRFVIEFYFGFRHPKTGCQGKRRDFDHICSWSGKDKYTVLRRVDVNSREVSERTKRK
jgi:hypothetical protein